MVPRIIEDTVTFTVTDDSGKPLSETIPDITQESESIVSPSGRFSAEHEVNSLISGFITISSYFAHTVYEFGVKEIDVGEE